MLFDDLEERENLIENAYEKMSKEIAFSLRKNEYE
jgi:hypothetical protein